MEILSPSSYFSNSSWVVGDSSSLSTRWTPAENKVFENALAVFDETTPDRWHKVAAMVPGKTVGDVIRQYKELEDDVTSIEAGLIPVPGYISSSSSSFTLDCGGGGHAYAAYHYDGFKQCYIRRSIRPPSDQERKKGIPWTEEEHKLFLMGLKKYGKGDWKNISRNFVITRTPTQVASHAQKYFIRQISGGKDKRRASIHDITTVSLVDNQNKGPSPDNRRQLGFSNSSSLCLGGNTFASSQHDINSYGLQRDAIQEPLCLGSQQTVFKMQPGIHYRNAGGGVVI